MPQSCAMEVTEGQTGIVAHLAGTLDAASASGVRDALLLLSEARKPACLVVDLSSVSDLDWQGAHLLAALSRRAYGQGTHIRLRAPIHHLRAILAAAAARPFLLA